MMLAVSFGTVEASAQSKFIEFSVERKGKTIGSHKTNISTQGGRTTVDIAMRLKAKFLGVPVYRFRYDSNEVWINNQLETLAVSVDENGKKSRLMGKMAGSQFSWRQGGVDQRTNGSVFPSNHWNSEVLKQSRVLNTLTGNLANVQIRKAGTDVLNCRRGKRKANRYQYSGDLNVEAWYDDNRNWVGLRFKSKDGSTIFFRC